MPLGDHLHSVAIEEDITAHKWAEQELVRRQQELTLVYDSAPVIMIVVDEDGRIVRVNRAAVEAAHRDNCGEMVGLKCGPAMRCIHAFDDPEGCGFGPACQTCEVRKQVGDTLRTGNVHHREEHQVVVEHDGKRVTVPMLISSVRLMLDDRPHALVMVEDISQQKRVEGQVRQREAELVQMNRLHAVGEMAAALAHELNQPLHVINNYVQGLQRRLKKQKAGPDQGQVIGAMDHIAAEVSRAAGIVARLREFVRGREPHRSSVDIRQLPAAGCRTTAAGRPRQKRELGA